MIPKVAIILTSNVVESSSMCFLIHGYCFFLVKILFMFYVGVVHLFTLLYSIPLYHSLFVHSIIDGRLD